MTNDRLKVLAKHYFYSWEIEKASEEADPVDTLQRMVGGVRRCLVHCDDISFTTFSGGTVYFYAKGNTSMQTPDAKTSIDELAEAVFTEKEQMALFN